MTQPSSMPPSPFSIRPSLRWPLLVISLALFGFVLFDLMFAPLMGSKISSRAATSTKMMQAIKTSLLAYSVIHDGRYPPDLACLILNRSISPDMLVFPGGTKPYQSNSLPPESDWPLIAADVAAHCDFVYTGADLTIIRNQDTRYSDIIVFYSKRLPKNPFRFIGFADGHVNQDGTDASFSKTFAASNAVRATLGLPPFAPDGPPTVAPVAAATQK